VSKIEAQLFKHSANSWPFLKKKKERKKGKKREVNGQLNVLSVFRSSDHQIRKIEAQQSSHPVPGAVLNCVFCPPPLSRIVSL